MKSPKMELAIFWLSIVGGLLLGGFAVAAWYGGNKSHAIWLGFGGVVCLLLLLALQLQKVVWENEKPPGALNDPIFRFDQRAWLAVDVIRPVPLRPEVGKPFQVLVKIKNSGKTPARNIVGVAIVEPTTEPRPNYDYTGRETFKLGTLAPNASGSVPLNPSRNPQSGELERLSQQTFDAIASGVLKVFVHGRVDYEDVFGGAPLVHVLCQAQCPIR